MNRHPFLRWYEVLLVRLLVHAQEAPLAWVVKKTIASQEPVEMLERAYANSPDADPA